MKKRIISLFAVFASAFAIFAQAENYKTYETSDKNAPVVYFTCEITPESLVKVYKAMGWQPHGKVGVKISLLLQIIFVLL